MLYAGTDHSAWEEFTQAIHSHGALISLQMSPFMRIRDQWVGPSEYRPGVHALTADEIDLIASLYAGMATLARRVGFDAVQVHAGHGYGLSQFLLPYFNRRHDAYGGSVENRAHILVQIRKAISENVGVDFPVWIKMNSFDGIPGGLISTKPPNTPHCWRKQATALSKSLAALSAAATIPGELLIKTSGSRAFTWKERPR